MSQEFHDLRSLHALKIRARLRREEISFSSKAQAIQCHLIIRSITSCQHNIATTLHSKHYCFRICSRMTSLASNMQALTLSSKMQTNKPSIYDFDCSAFDELSSFSPLAPIPEAQQSVQKTSGRRCSISRSHCARDLSSLAGSYSSDSSSVSLSSSQSKSDQNQAKYSGEWYGYFVDSVTR